MKRFLVGALACAFISAAAHGADRAGSTVMPGPKTQPLAEKLVAAADPAALSLPPLDNAKASVGLEENQVGVSRAADLGREPALTEQSLRWRIVEGTAVAQIRVSSPEALALRAALRFESIAPELEVRVAQRAADGSLEVVAATTGAQIHKAALGITPIEHWTATTVGAEQWIELRRPAGEATRATRFRLSGVSHFVRPLFADPNAKVLDFTCHVDVGCVTDETVRNDAKGVAKMVFSHDGRSFFCTGALLNDRASSLTPLFATAHHCISTSDVSASLETWWFYYATACEQNTQAPTRVMGGATLLMADPDSDFSLLRLNQSAPAGAVFLGWDAAPLAVGQAIFGLHHPDGSWQRYSEGTFVSRSRVTDSDTHTRFLTPFNRVRFTRGIVEGGSSGSPLLTAPNVFHGTLFGSPSSNACDSTNNTASYSEFSSTYPLVSTFLAGPSAADDHADAAAGATVLDPVSKIVAQLNRQGDSDWFRFDFAMAGRWTVSSFAPAGTTLDVAGTIYASNATTVRATNDDRSDTDFNFEMTFQVPAAGTYYLKVSSSQSATGAYGLRSTFDEYGDAFASAADLAVNATATGVLATATDQDWFRLTFTAPGTFRVNTTGITDTFGRLYRADGVTLVSENDDTTGTNFALSTEVTGPTTLYLQVTGFEGDIGTYGLTTTFTSAPSASANYTDSWWNAAESGWGLNVSHRGDVIFATLFTYATDGRDMWLVGAALARQANGSYSGSLFRTTGPAFNASPWTAITSSSVGTMTLTFTGDNQGTLVYSVNGVTVTKSITKQEFGTRPTCSFTTGSLAGATNYQDIWWNAAESGWGVNVTHHGSIIFATLFTYADVGGRDMWLVAPNLARQSDGSFSGALYRTTGPPFNTQPWTANSATEVGTMRFAFSSGTTGTLTYSYTGITVTKAIERQVFGSQVSVCQ